MLHLKKLYSLLLISVFVLTTTICKAQAPPAMAMPTEGNKVLIDKLIEVTKYEAFFRNHCITQISRAAEKNGWDEQKKEKTIKSINFKYFNSTIYNSFSSYSETQLKDMIELFTTLNTQKKNLPLFISNGMIENNLSVFVESLVEGKYIMKE